MHFTTCTPNNLLDEAFMHECMPVCSRTFFMSPVCRDDIVNIIVDLKNSNAAGHDSMSNNLLKKCNLVLCEILTYLVNLSVEHAVFPEQLKLATVVPLFKKGDTNDYENYRGISLLTSISKVFEVNIKNQLLKFLNRNNLLSKSQHGFMESRSTESALCEFQMLIADAMDKNLSVLGLFIDFSRAFDMVNHEILLKKLEYYGIRGQPLDLFKSYLSKRKQYVKVNGVKSDSLTINQGVPQGSVLGPLLYLVYSNDLIYYLQKKSSGINVISYADDTNVVIVENDENSLKATAEHVYSSAVLWSQKNCLNLSGHKTSFVVFSKQKRNNDNFLLFPSSGPSLAPSVSSTMLGLNFSENLRWESHIDNMCIKIRKNCYALKSLSNHCSLNTLLTVYYSNIHSHLTYGIMNWGAGSEVVRVFLLQKYAVRIILSLPHTESCRRHFEKLNLLTVVGVYIFKICIFAFQNRNMLQLNRASYAYNTRNKGLLLPVFHKSSFFQKNIHYNACRFFNHLNGEIKNVATLAIFKRKLKAFLVDKSCYTVEEFLS